MSHDESLAARHHICIPAESVLWNERWGSTRAQRAKTNRSTKQTPPTSRGERIQTSRCSIKQNIFTAPCYINGFWIQKSWQTQTRCRLSWPQRKNNKKLQCSRLPLLRRSAGPFGGYWGQNCTVQKYHIHTAFVPSLLAFCLLFILGLMSDWVLTHMFVLEHHCQCRRIFHIYNICIFPWGIMLLYNNNDAVNQWFKDDDGWMWVFFSSGWPAAAGGGGG